MTLDQRRQDRDDFRVHDRIWYPPTLSCLRTCVLWSASAERSGDDAFPPCGAAESGGTRREDARPLPFGSKALRAKSRPVGMSPDAQRRPTLATALQSAPRTRLPTTVVWRGIPRAFGTTKRQYPTDGRADPRIETEEPPIRRSALSRHVGRRCPRPRSLIASRSAARTCESASKEIGSEKHARWQP